MSSDRERRDRPADSSPARTPKRIKPRLVLVLLLTGSFAGVWLANLGESPVARVAWWVLITALGLLAGGLYWRLLLYDDVDFGDARTRQTVKRRWRRVGTTAIGGLAAGGAGSLLLQSDHAVTDVSTAVLAGIVLAVGLWALLRWTAEDGRGNAFAGARPLLFAVALALLGGVAWLETRTEPLDVAVRAVHLGSFALWLGGAAWHNGVVVPVVGSDPTAAPALMSQARRFRRHLPVLITLFLLTGVYQTVGLVGPSIPAFTSPIGRLVWFKVLVLAALTGLVLITLKRAGASRGD